MTTTDERAARLSVRANELVRRSGMRVREIDAEIARTLGLETESVVGWTSRLLKDGYARPDFFRLAAFCHTVGGKLDDLGEVVERTHRASVTQQTMGDFAKVAAQLAPKETFVRAVRVLDLVVMPDNYRPSSAIAAKILRVLEDAFDRCDELVKQDVREQLEQRRSSVPPRSPMATSGAPPSAIHVTMKSASEAPRKRRRR